MLKQELKKNVWNRYFLGTSLIVYLLLVISGKNGVVDLMEEANLAYYLYLVLDLSYAKWLGPLLVLLPCIFSYYEEWNSGQYYNVMLRSGKRKYVLTKLTSAMISGLLVMLIPFLLYCFVQVIRLGNVTYYGSEYSLYDSGSSNLFLQLEQGNGKAAVFLIELGTRCLCYMFYSAVGMAFLSYLRNKYLSLIAPFFCMVMSNFIYDMLGNVTGNEVFYQLHIAFIDNYQSDFKLAHMRLGGIPFTIGFLLLGIGICTGIYVLGIRWRLRNG